MTVLVLEDNLLWSVRLTKSIQSLGHEPIVLGSKPEQFPPAEVAIVNLGMPRWDLSEVVSLLKSQGTHVIGHAGHKEKELLELGKQAGCDTLATNSQLTFKIADLLAVATRPSV